MIYCNLKLFWTLKQKSMLCLLVCMHTMFMERSHSYNTRSSIKGFFDINIAVQKRGL